MTKTIQGFVVFGSIVLFAIACKKDVANISDVYVSGEMEGVPTYWRNGVANSLGTSNGHANSIFVLGEDVYVAGQKGLYAVVWKNGEAKVLDTSGETEALSVFVKGDDVYVAGYGYEHRNGLSYPVARYWKNGVKYDLSNSYFGNYASAISVVDTNVFVALNNGTSAFSRQYVGVWKNGRVQAVSDSMVSAVAYGLRVVGEDIYICGNSSNYNTKSTVWKNGKAGIQKSENNSFARSIAVANGDVYVGGYQYTSDGHEAILWKNGEPFPLTDGKHRYSYSTGVAVKGSDVCALVQVDDVRTQVWLNGVVTYLNKYVNTIGRAIFIK